MNSTRAITIRLGSSAVFIRSRTGVLFTGPFPSFVGDFKITLPLVSSLVSSLVRAPVNQAVSA